MLKRREILGVGVDMVGRNEALTTVEGWLKKNEGLKFVATVYSEFLVRADEDSEFKWVLNKADLAVPDGVSVLAAAKYLDEVAEGKRRWFCGWRMGGEILGAKLGERVTGVWLFESLVKLASKKGWRVFLLGGFGNKAERLTRELIQDYPNLVVEFDAGDQDALNLRENERVIEKINGFKPDLLFVAYGPVKQEKWIVANRDKLEAKVAIGVGGTFDEVLGDVARSPVWMEKRGLKWLWRLLIQPKRIGRIYKAVVVFPWKVFRAV
jgi:N-acetylglucosaminyldiphosphoundecaprenol N-acetyl-beta-D-mannosaminyltransferase